ncbi:hypothetical protein ACIOWG_03525 [Streptomyces sp. NPDC087658]|uniref:hypothetical protein n=1 Tax=Streptomyces sp. NPDC087658 TaxID=3365800 RepID=UPI00382F9D76
MDSTLPPGVAAALAQPPPACSPTALWWWSGEPLDRERLRDQLRHFARGGVFNLVPIDLAPSGPLFGSDADDPPFQSDAWWELLAGVCDDARALGIRIWFYDQLGFSGADLQARLVDERPAFGGRSLARLRTVVDGPGELRCPPRGVVLAAYAEPADGDGRPAGPALPLLAEDGRTVRAPGAGRWLLTLHHHVPLGFDYLGTGACEALLDQVHGAFERRLGDRLGTVVAGSFQDELPSLPTWSAPFADAFLKQRGYDLVPHLDALYEDGAGHPEAARIRRDYQLTRAVLAEEAFFRPLAAWHGRHGLLVGCDQQDPARAGHPVGGVELYADYARTHRWFSAPGSDHHGDARIHSSLAHLYGGSRTWIEAFHSTGWGGTLEETFDWLLPWLRAGATLYNPHAVYYTTKGGWWEWAPPGTDWRQPYWRHHRVFADAVTRLCAVLGLGSHLCDLAVLLPTTTAQAGTSLDGAPTPSAARAQDLYLRLVGDMTWFRTRPGILDRLGRDADVIDDSSLVRAEVARDGDGRARLRVADESYAAVVLPACTVLEQDTARRLVEFASAGGTVIALGALPESVIGAYTAADEGRDTVRDALRACFADGRAVFVPTPEDGGADEALAGALEQALAGAPLPVVRATVPVLARRVDGATVVFLTAGSPRATRASVAAPDGRGAAQGWLDARYDFDPARYAPAARVRVRDAGGRAVLLDPFGGPPRTLPVTPAADDDRAVDIDVPFDTGPAALLVLPAGPAAVAAEAAVAARPGGARTVAEIPQDAEWEMALVPTLDNTWGDFARPAARPDGRGDALTVTECRTFRAGGPDGPPVHATFGPRAVLTDVRTGTETALVWSDTLGIHKDPVHRDVLGPKGHVPEEFLRLGPAVAGTPVRVRTELLLDEDFDGHLAIGAAAAKTASVDGVPVALEDRGHLAMGPVSIGAGRHLLVLDLTPTQDIDLRAHMALVRDPERYRRPEWILAPGPRQAGGPGAVGTTLTLPARPVRAVVQIASRGRCVLRVNGEVVGRQGGFDPYADHAVERVRLHEIAAALRAGDNDLVVEPADDGDPAVLVDLVAHGDGTEPMARLHSDAGWWAERGGLRVAAEVRRAPVGDPAALYLRRRPHPLPGAAWLDPEVDDGTVVPVRFAVPGDGPGVDRLWCELPPGAREMTFDVHGTATVLLDGRERPAHSRPGPGGTRTVTVGLPADAPCGPRAAVLLLTTGPGRRAGAALAGPVRCAVGPGLIRTGDWETHGLAGYSGGVRYRRVVVCPRSGVTGPGRMVLDLGRVRGTAEVSVDGVAAGVRVCSPYTFDVTDAGPGAHTVEVTVFGTLAPYLDEAGPTHFVFPGQRVSGLLGPVRLVMVPG